MTAPDDPYNNGPVGPPGGPGQPGPPPSYRPPPSYGPPPGYGAPPPGYAPPPPPGYGPPIRRNNDKALLSMILGIVSMVSCGLVLGIPALIIGNKAKQEIGTSGEDGDSMATAGIILGWISTILSGLGILGYAAVLIFALSRTGG